MLNKMTVPSLWVLCVVLITTAAGKKHQFAFRLLEVCVCV